MDFNTSFIYKSKKKIEEKSFYLSRIKPKTKYLEMFQAHSNFYINFKEVLKDTY